MFSTCTRPSAAISLRSASLTFSSAEKSKPPSPRARSSERFVAASATAGPCAGCSFARASMSLVSVSTSPSAAICSSGLPRAAALACASAAAASTFAIASTEMGAPPPPPLLSKPSSSCIRAMAVASCACACCASTLAVAASSSAMRAASFAASATSEDPSGEPPRPDSADMSPPIAFLSLSFSSRNSRINFSVGSSFLTALVLIFLALSA
mmetsp:Transcript_17353/g.44424  ORF Transcript_17353/g.44424 Transcript_17353/m.44424 type:complete len:211 (-) Transcript_17353:574-1206(-)